LTVDSWSDLACPWCYIGKRRFETAPAGFERRELGRDAAGTGDGVCAAGGSC
jgi:hypothetical protein